MSERMMPDAPTPENDLDSDLARLTEHIMWSSMVGEDSEFTDALTRVLTATLSMNETNGSATPMQGYLLERLREMPASE